MQLQQALACAEGPLQLLQLLSHVDAANAHLRHAQEQLAGLKLANSQTQVWHVVRKELWFIAMKALHHINGIDQHMFDHHMTSHLYLCANLESAFRMEAWTVMMKPCLLRSGFLRPSMSWG